MTEEERDDVRPIEPEPGYPGVDELAALLGVEAGKANPIGLHGARGMYSLAELLGYPEKVVLAKARRLIRRGVVEGCACGCRGGWSAAETPVPGPRYT